MLVLGSFFIGDTLIYCTEYKPQRNFLKGFVRIQNLPPKSATRNITSLHDTIWFVFEKNKNRKPWQNT